MSRVQHLRVPGAASAVAGAPGEDSSASNAPAASVSVLAWRQDRVALSILAVALVIRVVVLLFAGQAEPRIDDERQYIELAGNLYHGNGFMIAGQLTSLRPPLYPAFVATIWWLTGHENLFAVRVAQSALSLVLCVLVYALAGRLYDRRAARLAMGLVAVYPSLLFATVLLLSEVLFTTLLIASALAFDRLIDRPDARTALVTGVVVGLGALTRSVLWPFMFLLLPLAFWRVNGSIRRRAIVCAAVVAGFVLTVGPWAVRNTRLQRTFTVVDTMGGMNLRMGNYEYTPEDRMWDAVAITGERNWSHALSLEHRSGAPLTEGQKEKWAQRKALTFMLQNPGLTVRRAVIKFGDFWGLDREFVAGVQRGLYVMPAWLSIVLTAGFAAAYPLVLLVALAGIFCAPPRLVSSHLYLLAIIATVCGIHTIVFGHSRYHLPLMPILVVYAAGAIAAFRTRRLELSPGRMVPTAAFTVLMLAIWGNEVLFVDHQRIASLLDALR